MVARRVTVRGVAPGLATSMKPTTKEDAGKARPIGTLKPIATYRRPTRIAAKISSQPTKIKGEEVAVMLLPKARRPEVLS